MKCFKCGVVCVMQYPTNGKERFVQSVCTVEGCGWKAHPTKIPEPLPKHYDTGGYVE